MNPKQTSDALLIANKKIAVQDVEKHKSATELLLAYKDLAFEIEEKGKRAAELIIANIELIFQNEAKENRAAELVIANEELAFQNNEKEKRAAELNLANIELAYQNVEKEKRAAELSIANKELIFQNEEKEKRAAELSIANKELAFQNNEKEKRAVELSIANIELAYQNEEKEKRAVELSIANKELSFNNEEKEKKAAELYIANEELAFQNHEKEKRAAELSIANIELAYQNNEKEKREAELIAANTDLGQFAYIASHDLQEPLRTIGSYIHILQEDCAELLDDKSNGHFNSINNAIGRMSLLVKSLLSFSRLGYNKVLTSVDCSKIIEDVIADLSAMINKSNTHIVINTMPRLNLYEVEIRQVFQNLITNAIKFRKKNTQCEIEISAEKTGDVWTFSVKDNGIGIDPIHFQQVFNIFQRLKLNEEYEGSGIGLANCKKIIQLHHGEIWIESKLEQGATFHFTIPNLS